MKIIVCIKQVPDTNEVKINKETGTLIRTGVPSIVNPDDKNAVEEALAIRDANPGTTVTVLSMGPPQAELALKELLAMGADEAILLSDRAFAGSDTWATATILAAAVEKIGGYDIVMCGRQAIDGDTAQVGPEMAEFLGLPQITYASNVKVEGENVIVERKTEDGHFVIQSPMPVLLTAIKELNQPRFADARLIYKAYSSEANYKQWSVADLDIDLTQIGVKNSPTNVYKSFTPVKEFNGQILKGTPKELANSLVDELKKLNLV